MAEDVSSTVPFLNDDEIYAPREVAVKNNRSAQSSRLSLRMTSGILYISNPGSFTMLSVFDLQGRLIATIDLQHYRQSGGNCVLPLLRLLKRNGLRMFVIRLSGKGTSRMFNIINGSLR